MSVHVRGAVLGASLFCAACETPEPVGPEPTGGRDPFGSVGSDPNDPDDSAAAPGDPIAATATSGCFISQVAVAAGADITVDWSNLTADVLGDPLVYAPATDGAG